MRLTLYRTLTALAFAAGVSLLLATGGTAQDASSGSEIKKRLDYWKNSYDADILFQGVPPDPSAAATTPARTGPRAVALCIGVDNVSRDHYRIHANSGQYHPVALPLWGAAADAR